MEKSKINAADRDVSTEIIHDWPTQPCQAGQPNDPSTRNGPLPGFTLHRSNFFYQNNIVLGFLYQNKVVFFKKKKIMALVGPLNSESARADP